MLQVVPRAWPAEAVHDTVEAVVRGDAFRRSLQSSVAERLLAWIGEWMGRLARLLDGRSSMRALALGFAGVLVLLVVARLLLAARARDAHRAGARGGGARRGEDPWRAAERLTREGRFEAAAHALYRAVLVALAREQRVVLHPSKTSGDYGRELRARGSDAYAPFRAFSRRFDLAVYGKGGCDAAVLDELRRLAAPFAPRARAA